MGAAHLEGPPCRRPYYCFAWGELVACLAERCWWVKAVEVSRFLGQFPRHKKQVQRPDCSIPRARRSSVEGGHTRGLPSGPAGREASVPEKSRHPRQVGHLTQD